MRFADRADAGRRLARALARYPDRDSVVLALPRGGLPVAAEIAGIALDRGAGKATTSEGLGFAGRREGIACLAVATVRLPARRTV